MVKIGSAVLAPAGELDEQAIARIVDEVAAAKRGGCAVVLVSSGAVASGFRALGLSSMPKAVREKQAAAAIGQPRLMRVYSREFWRHGLVAAQVLLTSDDFQDRERFLNARHTLNTLLESNVTPIINENDSVSFDEIKLGDNDRLSALTAGMIGAELLLILSSAPGLLNENGAVTPEVQDLDAARELVTPAKTGVGTGGFITKLDAVAVARAHGVPCVVCGGAGTPIADALCGRTKGTHFPLPKSKKARASARKGWIGHATRTRGAIVVDDGAAAAIVRRGASLLPKGIVVVEGEFQAGAAVEIRTLGGLVIARGLSSYSSGEAERLRGAKTDQIEERLGYFYSEEVVHRDDLAVLVSEDAVLTHAARDAKKERA